METFTANPPVDTPGFCRQLKDVGVAKKSSDVYEGMGV